VSAPAAAASAAAASSSTVRPILLGDRAAAAAIGFSVSWIRATRAADAKAIREGRKPTGPPWVVLGGKTIRYRVADLEAWIAGNVEERGVVQFSNRGGGAK
jgi:hypothetical protein